MNRRRSHEVVESLRSRQPQQDPLLAGLLALSLEADVVAPHTQVRNKQVRPTPTRPTPTRSRRPVFAGLATTTLAGAALVFSSVAQPSTSPPTSTPTSTPSASAQTVQVTKLLNKVKSDLATAVTKPVASRAPLLAQATATLKQAEAQSHAVPSQAERTQLDSSAAALHAQLERTRTAPPQAAGATDPTTRPTPSARPSRAPHPTPSSGQQGQGQGQQLPPPGSGETQGQGQGTRP